MALTAASFGRFGLARTAGRGFGGIKVVLCALWVGATTPFGAYACVTDIAVPESRTILALFDGAQEAQVRDTRIHRFLEFPLNHLGYRVDYLDVSRALAPDILGPDIAAVVSWFDAPLADPAPYLKWMSRVETSCPGELKQIVLGDIGAPAWFGADGDRDILLGRLGLRLVGNEKIFGYRSAIRKRDPELIGFETEFTIEPGRYPSYRSTSAGRSFLQIIPRKQADDDFVDLAVVGPRGGYLHASAALSFDERSGTAAWVTDPFGFLDAVLGQTLRPVPDVTTLDGRRMFFSTVSSEGWLASMPARGFDDEPKLASETLLDRMIRPFPDLPTTVAVLLGDLDPSLGGGRALLGRAVAGNVFRLPQVRMATTGFSLIRDWGYFANYDRARETQKLDEYQSAASSAGRSGGLVNRAAQGLATALINDELGVSDRIPNAPRKYANDAFDLYSEFSRSLQGVALLGPAGGRPVAFLWSGDGRPFEAALRAVEAQGVPAIGGGGGVYNASSPSLSGLSPFSVRVGAETQVYNALSGDEAYTNFWSTPTYGFQALAETLKWTETPRRLKAFQLGYAAQSMIDFGNRRAVEILLERARTADVTPVTVAEYVAIVKGFDAVQAVRTGRRIWQIRNRGALSTVRFDRAASILVDMAASTGVLGARRNGSVLYVALDPATADPVIALTDGPDPSGMRIGSAGIGLSESRLQVLGLRRVRCTTTIEAAGYGDGPMVWFGPPDTDFTVRITSGISGPTTMQDQTVRSAPDGRFVIAVVQPGVGPVSIAITGACRTG